MSQPAMFQLTEEDRQLLLQIARDAVRAHLSGDPPQFPVVSSGVLTEPHGIFVSIHEGHEGQQLRGCIGNIQPSGPLYRSAADCAIAAAVGDPRFMPMTIAELTAVEFEISVLSPLESMQDIREIEIGKHGLLISKRSARGLLLPQVATMYGWDREQFLQETCRKAGLRPDDWKEGATIQHFTASVFSERQFRLSSTT